MNSPRDDIDLLLDEAIETSTQFLQENGELCPFAVVLGTDGEVRYVQCEPADEFTQSEGLIEITEATLRELAMAGEIRASALVSDVFIHGKTESDPDTDAIRLSVEHLEAMAVTCYLPYNVLDKTVTVGELVAEEGEGVVFLDEEEDEDEEEPDDEE